MSTLNDERLTAYALILNLQQQNMMLQARLAELEQPQADTKPDKAQ